MKNEIEDLEGPQGDETSRRKEPANPEESAGAVERQSSVLATDPAQPQRNQRPEAGVPARKRRKRFVL
jgi:hypothetical protein